jgi:multiple sugar transport system substrate-binding protein
MGGLVMTGVKIWSRRAVLATALAMPLVWQASPGAAEQAKLSFLAAEYSAASLPFWEKTVAAFEAANPDIDVTLEVVGWNTMHDTTAQRIAAGTMPDLVNTATIWVPEWVDADAIRPLGPDLVSAEKQADFLPALFEKGAAYKGQNWGLPIAAAARAVFYNDALMAKAGLDPKAPPKTWDEFKTTVLALKEKTGSFGFAFDAKGVRAFRNFGFFLWNNGGDFFDANGKAAFNSPAGVEALTFLVELAKSGAVPDPLGTTLEDFQPMFEAGRVATMISGNFAIAGINKNAPDLKYSVGAVPIRTADTPPVTWGVTDTLVISKKASADAAKKFIEHIFSAPVRTEFDTAEGMLPVLASQAGDPAFGEEKIKAFLAMIPSSRFDPLHPNYNQMQELVKAAMQAAISGQADPKAALDKAAVEFDKLVKS